MKNKYGFNEIIRTISNYISERTKAKKQGSFDLIKKEETDLFWSFLEARFTKFTREELEKTVFLTQEYVSRLKYELIYKKHLKKVQKNDK